MKHYVKIQSDAARSKIVHGAVSMVEMALEDLESKKVVNLDEERKAAMHDSNAIPVSFLRMAVLNNFVCGQCGYVESYIAKEKDLAAIKKKWPLVF